MDLDDAIHRFRGPLVGLIASWGAPVAEAVELAEEAFAEAYLRRDACRGDLGDPLVCGRWLRGVAKNRFRNWLRARRRRERRVVSIEPAALALLPAPDDQAEGDRLERLRDAIDRLPDKQRRVVLMHYLEETTLRDVAAVLSVTPKTVEGRLYQARKALRRMLGAERGQPDREGSAT